MSVELIPAQPTRQHGLAFAGYLETAGEGIFRLMLGSGFAEVLATAYQQPGHVLSFESVTFATDAGSIVGMLNAFSSEQHAHSSTRPLVEAAGWRGLRMGVFAAAGYPLFRFLDQIPDGDFYVQALAVSESERGKGIGSRLLDHTDELAVGAGQSRLSLHVDVKNSGAERLYGRHGLTVEATSDKAWLIGGKQAHRMAKPLT